MTPDKGRPLRGWRVERSESGALEQCSLIVATYRRPREVLSLLRTMQMLPEAPREVILVDGAPTEQFSGWLRGWAQAQALSFDLLYVESRPGLTVQRNVGVDVSAGQYLFFLDDDAVPLQGYFSHILRVFEQDRNCAIGAVAGCIVNEMDRPMVRRWRLRLALGLIPRIAPMMYHPAAIYMPRALLKPFHGTRRVQIFPGGAVALRREVFERQRFSEFFQGYCQGEDLEMSLRVGREWLIICAGDAHAWHTGASGGRPPGFAKGMMEVWNRFFIWRRYTPKPTLKIRAIFWADILFLITMDLAWFAVRPWRPSSLAHGAGLAWGALRCILMPPRYEEPPAGRVYRLAPPRAAEAHR